MRRSRRGRTGSTSKSSRPRKRTTTRITESVAPSNAMSSRPSSSPGDPGPRSAWPWLLAAGPALVVVASLATAWIAFRHDDALVAADYYKLGLLINRRLAASPPPAREPAATVAIAADGVVRVRIDATTPAPAALHLTVRRPG